MKVKGLKPKMKGSDDKKHRLPLRKGNEIVGVFNGLNVVIHDWYSMKYLYEEGCFGKGSFSKGAPNYHAKKDDVPKIVSKQQFENQSKWSGGFEYICPLKHYPERNGYELSRKSVEKFLEYFFENSGEKCLKPQPQEAGNEKIANPENSSLESDPAERQNDDDKLKCTVDEILESQQGRKPATCSVRPKSEVIVWSCESDKPLPTADSLNARLEQKLVLPEENLNLNWEESLYLNSILGCLTIIDSDKQSLTGKELWQKFKAADKYFVGRYVTYHHFRSKGWTVRSGTKFGADYLLYKIGPADYHSDYLVKVLNEKKLSWRELIAYNRLAETFNKGMVFVKVFFHETGGGGAEFPELLEKCRVEETLLCRWFPSKERQVKSVAHAQ